MKDLFYFFDHILAFQAGFSNTVIELEHGSYRLGEVVTDFLNYDATAYNETLSRLNKQIERNDYDGFLETYRIIRKIILDMPLYGFALVKPQLFEPELLAEDSWPEELLEMSLDGLSIDEYNHKKIQPYSQSFNALGDDIAVLKTSYTKFLSMMDSEVKTNKTDNRYAQNIEKSAITPFMSGRSLGHSGDVDPADVWIRYSVDKSKSDGAIEVFEEMVFHRLLDFAYVEFFKAMMQQNIPKKCKLCGTFFLLESGYKYEYCDKLIANGSGKTCRDVGASKNYQTKIENDLVWKVHKRAYKKYYARIRGKLITKEAFEEWAAAAEKLRLELANKGLSETELTEKFNWIK
jgi:hypothetical protein